MLYAALTFWLLVVVFCAWGVHQLWSGLAKPRVVNAVLLPGTLVAQLGHVLGLLVTGNPVKNTTLMEDDEKGDPKTETPETPKVPIFGSLIIGLLPLAACAACLYFVEREWGGPVLGKEGVPQLAQSLPTSLAEFWQFLRDGITVSERMLDTIRQSDLLNWRTFLFLYLAICLTVRMAPFEGHRRGALGAILLAGLTSAILGSFTPQVREFVESSWPTLGLMVGLLLFLLLFSLSVRGLVGLVRILARNE